MSTLYENNTWTPISFPWKTFVLGRQNQSISDQHIPSDHSSSVEKQCVEVMGNDTKYFPADKHRSIRRRLIELTRQYCLTSSSTSGWPSNRSNTGSMYESSSWSNWKNYLINSKYVLTSYKRLLTLITINF